MWCINWFCEWISQFFTCSQCNEWRSSSSLWYLSHDLVTKTARSFLHTKIKRLIWFLVHNSQHLISVVPETKRLSLVIYSMYFENNVKTTSVDKLIIFIDICLLQLDCSAKVRERESTYMRYQTSPRPLHSSAQISIFCLLFSRR